MRKANVYGALFLGVLMALGESASSGAAAWTAQSVAETPPRSMIGAWGIFGLWVDQVAPGSPAADAGIQRGDIITRVDRTPIDHDLRFRQVIGDAEPGTTFKLYIRRYDDITREWGPKVITVTSVPFREE
jgi:S1-C subfamily serine protease